jgi:dolichol-phosphate mannosyltransferase
MSNEPLATNPVHHQLAWSDSKRLVVVLPVYNEADSITAVLGEVREAAERLQLSGVTTSVVVVDDESPDGTGAVAAACAERVGIDLTLVRGARAGLGSAMLRGLAEALEQDPDAIVTLDGDGQHNPTDIPTLHRAFVARQADIVIGSRWTRGGRAPGTSPGRALGSRVGNWLFRAATGTRGVKDATTSFRVYSPRVVRFLLSTDSDRYSGYSFFSTTVGLAEAAGYMISEVPIEFRPRYGGQSKLNRREVWRYFSTLPALRDERRRYAGEGHESPYLATDEIDLLSKAKRWNRFVVDASLSGAPSTGLKSIIEVGAGLGGVTEVLLERFPSATITAIEPDDVNHRNLAKQFADEPRVRTLPGTLEGHRNELRAANADLVIYISVLEHIAEHGVELKTAADLLRRGGTLSIFVPAMPGLYGPIDARSGHFRRYTDEHLRGIVEAAGFDVVHLAYVDRLGIVPYWLNYRVLNKAGISGGSVWAFDRIFVPMTRFAERFLGRVPAGKNVVCTATRR